jgi:hypothetical protein
VQDQGIAFNKDATIQLIHSIIMSLFVHRGNINSTCVNVMRVSLLNGTATAQLKDGSVYHYMNVSRRAIAKFLMDDARSLGKFFNFVCQAGRTKCVAVPMV